MGMAINLKEFRESMVRHGLLVADDLADDEYRAENAWRLRHLTAMVMMVGESNAELPVDVTSTPEGLFSALADVVPLQGSVIYSLQELLEALEEDPEEQGGSALQARDSDTYKARLLRAIEDAQQEYPWRVGADSDQFTRKVLVSAPPPKSLPPED